MGMTITNCWKLFRYGVKRNHYDKWSVSENSRKDLLKIASTITSHLIVGPHQITYLSLMSSMIKIQFPLAAHFNFLLLFLPPLLSTLFRTWLKAVPRILPKKKKPSWEEVTVHGSCLMEKRCAYRAFGFATDVVVSTIKGYQRILGKTCSRLLQQ